MLLRKPQGAKKTFPVCQVEEMTSAKSNYASMGKSILLNACTASFAATRFRLVIPRYAPVL